MQEFMECYSDGVFGVAYTAWKVRYDKQKNIIDSLRQVNIKIINEK